MAPATRPDHPLSLDGLPHLNMAQSRSANASQATSPIEPSAGSALRYPLGNGMGSGATSQAGTGRAGAGSPSKEFSSRLFAKRAREIQQQEGLSPQIWGPPTTASGHSTPLRENIPESPGSDSFPDFDADQATTGSPNLAAASNSARRARAGTVPSRFPLPSSLNSSQSSQVKFSNRSPSASPYQASTPAHADHYAAIGAQLSSNAALLSRLRAGSVPQRPAVPGTLSPFGNSVFMNNWMSGRQRASTLQSIRSSDAPSSPRESPADNDVRTLDYLGLVDTPQSSMDVLMGQQRQGVTIADLAALNAFNNKNTANRFRSYSVNAKEKYADVDDDELDAYAQMQPQLYAGTMTPTAESAAAHAAAIQEAVRQHNLEVQAFANFASANRPRARTAGVLDSPSSRVLRHYLPTPSRLENSMTSADLQADDGPDFTNLTSAVQSLTLNPQASSSSLENGLESNLETPTRALWLGNIPSSTTVSSLNVIFGQFGPIEFARVLTHKGCGFVNFDNVQSAMAAKAQCNGKEIFPGCGPIRIGFAKEQSASNTPGANGAYPSPSPDPFVSKGRADNTAAGAPSQPSANINAETAAAALATPDLMDLRDEIYSIVQQFGATPEEKHRIAALFETTMSFDGYAAEIAPIPEPSHNRVHDAPRLRDIRKRIDNNSCTAAEIENMAMEMLPEIAELSSDYLGNTVVQKLFEHCSEDTKEAMLAEISPHLAEVGVHKNGTWAAQKIIDVARTREQMQMIAQALQPHGVNLFLDQYGNYVMQCCLRFQSPMNDFVFATMLRRLWDVAQGRFGARAVRACLESHFATNEQKRVMAAAIALHSVQLATNSNGALLLTWFLDTCNFPRRRSVLAPRLIPHLVHLCTHKVAYLTVLKIINQKVETDARDSILRALFFDEQTLTDIISDQSCGATFIFKVLTTPFLDEALRPECLENVRNVLLHLKAQPSQGYKRLMDEAGLSTRHAGTPAGHDSRSRSRTRQMNGHLPNLDTTQNGYARPPYQQQHMPTQHAQMEQHGISPGLQRSVSMDSNSFDPYGNGLPQYTHSPAISATGGGSPGNSLQYAPGMMQQPQAQISRPPGFYMNATAMQNNMAAYAAAAASPAPQMMDPYRQNLNATPMLPPGMGMQTGFPPAGYGAPPPMMASLPPQYGHQYQMPQYFAPHNAHHQMPQGQVAAGQQRRGRVGRYA